MRRAERTVSAGLACCAAIGLLAASLPAAAAPPSRTGKVTYFGGSAAYVDRGSVDGLEKGGKLELVRRKRVVGTCEIAQIAQHHAMCRGVVAEPGDRFTLPPAATPAAPALVPSRPALSGADVLAARRERVLAAPLSLVKYTGPRMAGGPAWSANGSVTVRHQSFFVIGEGAGFQRPSVDAQARAGLGFLPGLYAAGALRLQGDVLAPPEHRTRPNDPIELYVWEAAVGLAEGVMPVVGALGRIRPRKAPGLVILDGAQVGALLFGGALEVGGYAGALPDLLTVTPSADRLTAGGYFGLDLAPTGGFLILPRARVGFVARPDLSLARAEVEAQTQVLVGDVLQGGVSARAGVGGADPLPTLDAVRADVGFVPLSALQVRAGYRYLAPLSVDFDLSSAIPAVGGAHHADASIGWRPSSWVTLTALGGAALDVTTDAVRGWAGPELGFPTLFGDSGGLSVFYLEELGDVHAGRSAAVTATVRPFSMLWLTGRGSVGEVSALGDPVREGSLLLIADAPVLSWLSFRALAQTLAVFPSFDDIPRATPTAVLLDVGVTGTL